MNSSNSIMIRAVLVLIIFISSSLEAHRPIFTNATGAGPDKAIKIQKPDVSQVIYRKLAEKTPQLWLAVEAKKEFKLFVQIGIPVIERLKEFRPAFAVVGPGLPSITLPFTIPKGMGGKAFTTEKIKKPRFFHEHFTQTDSWILRSETITLPASGRYYVVAYSPIKRPGKFWLSVGSKERFSLSDLLLFGEWTKKIQAFHEVDAKEHKTMLIDDFTDPKKSSQFGTSWRCITDRVMGGVSEGKHVFGRDDQCRYIHVTGNVSLENNGGFVQVALPLLRKSKPLDATEFKGIRLWTKGNGQTYYVHLKNSKTRQPWQYYSAPFTAAEQWKQVEIPFTQFKPQNLNAMLKTDSLSRIAMVGAKKAFQIDLYIGPIELYRQGLKQKKKK